MSAVSLLLMLLVAASLQALFPAPLWAGQATAPVLLALVVYYALHRPPGLALTAALLAGLFQDSLSLMPLGYSAFAFSLCGLLILGRREVMIVGSPFTHAVLTAVAHAAATLLLTLLLWRDGAVVMQPLWAGLKILGALALGTVTGPVVVGAAQALEAMMGLTKGRTEHDGAQRSFYGLG